MTRTMTITEVRSKLLALVNDVEHGDEIEITRRGIVVARLAPARGPQPEGRFAGIVTTNATDEDLLSTGEPWEAM